jgi:hypothetical protein
MKKLPLTFRHDKYDYAQIERSPTAAIYSQSQDGKVAAYEVIQIRIDRAHEAFGRQLPESERYPGSNDWGKYGWTYSGKGALEQAQATYSWLNRGREGERPNLAVQAS